jgi:hypothetical protein
MADPTAITVQALAGPFDAIIPDSSGPTVVGNRDIQFTALTPVNGDSFTPTGRELILIQNGAGTNTVTVVAVADNQGRGGAAVNDLVYSVGANEFAVLPMALSMEKGWRGIASPVVGKIKLVPSSGNLSCAVVRLPAGYGR